MGNLCIYILFLMKTNIQRTELLRVYRILVSVEDSATDLEFLLAEGVSWEGINEELEKERIKRCVPGATIVKIIQFI